MIRKGFSYSTFNIKEHTSEKGAFYTFSIRDNIENADDTNKYQYYSCITFSPVILTEGCKIKLDNLVTLSSKLYNSKVYQNLNVEITVIDQDIP